MKRYKHGKPKGKTCRWAPQLDEVLLEGIEDNDQGRQLANERLKGLHPIPQGRDRHPRDFEKWLNKIFEKETEYGVRPWLTLEFWQQEVDRVLVEGIFSRHGAKDAVVDRIRSVWPKLSPPWLCERREEVARLGLTGFRRRPNKSLDDLDREIRNARLPDAADSSEKPLDVDALASTEELQLIIGLHLDGWSWHKINNWLHNR